MSNWNKLSSFSEELKNAVRKISSSIEEIKKARDNVQSIQHKIENLMMKEIRSSLDSPRIKEEDRVVSSPDEAEVILIKECPHCSGESSIYHSKDKTMYYVGCTQCPLSGPLSKSLRKAAILWNRMEFSEKPASLLCKSCPVCGSENIIPNTPTNACIACHQCQVRTPAGQTNPYFFWNRLGLPKKEDKDAEEVNQEQKED